MLPSLSDTGHFVFMSLTEFWYVHLKTVRITSMEFSPDSSMVAVAGWEGSWHSYRKVRMMELRSWSFQPFNLSMAIHRWTCILN